MKADVEFSWSQKEGFGVKANAQVPFENKDLRQVVTDVTSAKAKATKVATGASSEVLRQGKNALIHGSVRAGLFAVPAVLTYANASAALNSPTYPQSLDSARHNFSRIEDFSSFDSNESNEDRLAKLKLHKSSKF